MYLTLARTGHVAMDLLYYTVTNRIDIESNRIANQIKSGSDELELNRFRITVSTKSSAKS